MKIFKLLFTAVALLLFLLIWFDQSRSFYCIDSKHCVTVWKRLGGVCYIVPRKYYGILKPSDNYIKTDNNNIITILWEENTNNIIIDGVDSFAIKNKNDNQYLMIDYSSNKNYFDSSLTTFDGQYHRYKDSIYRIDINIFEGYATDNKGRRL